MWPVAVPLVPVKVVPAVKAAVPALTLYVVMVRSFLALTTKPVLALAEAKATEPAVDCALIAALVLVRAPVLRLPEDLTATAEEPDTAPVVKVPAVTSTSTAPVLLLSVPTLVLPVASRVMLPVALALVAERVPPAAPNTTVPDLAVTVPRLRLPAVPADTLMPRPAVKACAVTPPEVVLVIKMSPGTVMAPRLIRPAAVTSRFCVLVPLLSCTPPAALRTSKPPPKADSLLPTTLPCDSSSMFLAEVMATSVVALFCAKVTAPVLLVICSTDASVSSKRPAAVEAKAALPTSPSALTDTPPPAAVTFRS